MSLAPIQYFGKLGVDFDQPVIQQMEKAASIPVAVRGAVMPDAHLGYALPIGGVIALEDAVSPSFVGYDIACRMSLSIAELEPHELMKKRTAIAEVMRKVTSFGVGAGFKGSDQRDHAVMNNPLWNDLPILRSLRSIAQEQLGSSGGGNHFFDALIGEVLAPSSWFPLQPGQKFVAFMTHSGSRRAGHQVATHYHQLAEKETRANHPGVPGGYEWLSLRSQAGQEYWQVMGLMGEYAQANHHLIHEAFFRSSRLRQVGFWENHHNFAFEEDGLIIHRKGATPAQVGLPGIIPGSSGAASYLVEGLGNVSGLNSSSHGAGRRQSRTEARKTFNENKFKNHMRAENILSIGVEPDETFSAYKDIEHVMELQEGVLVKAIARMKPVIVVMGGKSDDGD